MKSDQPPKTSFQNPRGESLFDLDQPQLNDPKGKSEPLIDSNKLICVSNKKGKNYCSDEDCKHHAILCGDEKCQCSLNHQECSSFYKINKLNHQILKNVKHTDFGESIQLVILKIQDCLSQLEEKLIKKMRYCGLRITQQSLLRYFQRDYNKLIKKNQKFEPWFTGEDIDNYLNEQKLSEEERLKEFSQGLIELVQQKKTQTCQKLDQIVEMIRAEFQEQIKVSFQKSKILKTKYEAWKLNKFLDSELKSNNSSELIFRGTVNGMSMEQFHQKCDNKPNLLYLVENEFGFKYGGYSPCPISIDRLGKYEKDDSKSSFIFSLDTNKKAKVSSKQFAIKNGYKSQKSSVLISFGSSFHILTISSNSLQKAEMNWISFQSDHEKSGYQKMKDPPKHVECNGTQSWKCKLRQVQVYELKFNKGRLNAEKSEAYRIKYK